jgi:hypothetical protein
VDLAVLLAGFENPFLKCFSRKYKNASKIHISVNLAPKLLKQILLCFLALDISVKNIACQICDTFICSFI